MKQVEALSAYGVKQLETKINEWLKANCNLKNIKLHYSLGILPDGTGVPSVMIAYDKPYGKSKKSRRKIHDSEINNFFK